MKKTPVEQKVRICFHLPETKVAVIHQMGLLDSFYGSVKNVCNNVQASAMAVAAVFSVSDQ